MSEDITEIKPDEITKPKKLAKKALGLLEAGLGGILQETISLVLSGLLPSQIPGELAKAGEALGLMVVGGTIDNKHVKNILGGAIAGSAKDLAKMILARLNVNLADLKLGIKAPTQLRNGTVPVITGATDADMEDY